MNRKLRILFRNVRNYGAALVLVAAGCGGTTPMGTGTAKSSALTGRVDNGASASANSNVTVSASRVNDDGTLTVVSDKAAQVGADGRYTLSLNSDANANTSGGGSTQLIVTAVDKTNSMVVGRSAVEGDFSGTNQVTVSPINATSTAETNLLVAARSSGEWTSSYSFGQLRALLSDQGAASLMAGTTDSTSASAKAAAKVAISSMAAWQSMLSAQGVQAMDLKTSLSSVQSAEVSLDKQLDASATSTDAQNAAAAANFTAFTKAFTDTGASSQELALASTASATTMVAFAGSLQAQAQAQATARANANESLLVSGAINAAFQSMGATQVVQKAAADAGTTLQTQIAAAATAGAQSQAQMQAAWQSYQTAVSAALTTSVAIDPAVLATIQGSLVTNLKGLTTTRTSLASQTSAKSAADAEAKALLQFRDSSLVNQAQLTGAGKSAAQATAFLNASVDLAAAGSTNSN